uniref:Hemoglobin subunit alpha n=1 Tax=Suricata suricatta TaxID=37032 RepID=A0A673TUS8_SURSU
MVLSAADKSNIKAAWDKIGSHGGEYGMVRAWGTMHPEAPVWGPAQHLLPCPEAGPPEAHDSPLAGQQRRARAWEPALPQASGPHGKVRSRPDDSLPPQHLGHCLLVTLARHYPGDFSPALHASLDTFLRHVTSALASSYG